MTRILIAIDSTFFLPLIGDYLATLHSDQNVTVRVLHVVEPLEGSSGWPNDQCQIDAEELVVTVVQKLRERCAKISFEGDVVLGHPKEVILDQAATWKADLILMGSHGRRGVNRFLLGSVSAAVATHAHCSVVILRQFEAN